MKCLNQKQLLYSIICLLIDKNSLSYQCILFYYKIVKSFCSSTQTCIMFSQTKQRSLMSTTCHWVNVRVPFDAMPVANKADDVCGLLKFCHLDKGCIQFQRDLFYECLRSPLLYFILAYLLNSIQLAVLKHAFGRLGNLSQLCFNFSILQFIRIIDENFVWVYVGVCYGVLETALLKDASSRTPSIDAKQRVERFVGEEGLFEELFVDPAFRRAFNQIMIPSQHWILKQKTTQTPFR